MSPDNTKKFCVDESIHRFINSLKSELPKHTYNECAQMVLKFCKLLREAVGIDDPLYRFCRSRIENIVDSIGIIRCNSTTKELTTLNVVFMFVHEVVVTELSRDLELSI